MEIKNFDGNILDSSAEVIMHQVNCQGVMGSGVAKAIKTKWPVVFDKYKECTKRAIITSLMGKVLPVKVEDNKTVLNLFGQENYGSDGRRYTSYDAIDTCLKKTAKYCVENGIKTIALPYYMSCGRGGANWDIIMDMIKQHFSDIDITIEIWKLN